MIREEIDVSDNDEEKSTCCGCGNECKAIEETFDYTGTHCTNGNGGTHRTGNYISDCCLDDIEES